MKNIFSKLYLLLFLLNLVLIPNLLFARAGGAGGGHSSGGGGHSSGGFSHSSGGYSGGGIYVGSTSSGDSSFSTIFIIIIFLIIFIYQYNAIQRRKSTSTEAIKSEINPADSEFLQKVRKAFFEIQTSWSNQSLKSLRRYITDGVYQRFNAQFTMMKLLGQADQITNVQIIDMQIVSRRHDGIYDVIEVCIDAYAEDQFVSSNYPNLNSPGGGENFTEYWSFIRRQDYKKGFNLFNSEVCPNCSAPLQGALTESAQCPHCSTYLNNGEYDWVLAEITQADDYQAPTPVALEKELADRLPDYSTQLIEDRASNAFMQILIAQATKQQAPLERFTTAEAYMVLKKSILEKTFLYDRLFLNSVRVAHFQIEADRCLATIDVDYSFRRVQMQGMAATLLDDEIIKKSNQIVFLRELSPTKPKGSVYANSCSHCGATQKDSLSSICSYCGQALNNSKTEWLIHESSALDL